MESSGGRMHQFRKWRAARGNPFYLRTGVMVSFLVLVVAATVWFRTTIYEENSRYNTFITSPTAAAADYFLDGFAKSSRAAGVRVMRDSLRFEEAASSVKQSCATGHCRCFVLEEVQPEALTPDLRTRYDEMRRMCSYQRIRQYPDIDLIDQFLTRFPEDTVYVERVLTIRQSLAEGQPPVLISGDDDVKPQQSFLKGVVDYAAESGNKVISVKFTQRTALKDYEDYPEEIRAATDRVIALGNELEGTHYPPPSEKPPVSINTFFKGNTGALENRLMRIIQVRMDRLFGDRALVVKRSNEESPAGIVLDVEYLVSTLEDNFGDIGFAPSLYVWQTQNGRGLNNMDPEILKNIPPEDLERIMRTIFRGYLLATNIDWDLVMYYPGSSTIETYAISTRPQAEMQNVESNNMALKRMMETAFSRFADSFLAEFGDK